MNYVLIEYSCSPFMYHILAKYINGCRNGHAFFPSYSEIDDFVRSSPQQAE